MIEDCGQKPHGKDVRSKTKGRAAHLFSGHSSSRRKPLSSLFLKHLFLLFTSRFSAFNLDGMMVRSEMILSSQGYLSLVYPFSELANLVSISGQARLWLPWSPDMYEVIVVFLLL